MYLYGCVVNLWAKWFIFLFLFFCFFQEYNFQKFGAAFCELTSGRRKLADGLFERYFLALQDYEARFLIFDLVWTGGGPEVGKKTESGPEVECFTSWILGDVTIISCTL